MSKYAPTIGLEIHAELKTNSKMFSPSKNDPDEKKPNVNIHPIDIAHPGTLPTINKKAIEHMIRIGLAVDGEIANFTEFDRKNYFYPDIPKGYQISQYKHPIVSGGKLAGFDLTRIHLEEDTGMLKHFDDYSLVDFNRAGIPLMELVTEPVLHSADDVIKFARELQLLLRYLEASDANIEKGEMRIEVNISVSKDKKLGGKVEIKNIGSISAAGRATDYEIKRQTKALEKGETIPQETRGWDESKQKTFSQRKKESAHDYRYFPEPDLPKLYLHELFNLKEEEKKMPELPWERRERYKKEFGIDDEATEIFVNDPKLSFYFEAIINDFQNDKNFVKKASNLLTSHIVGLLKENPEINLPDPISISKVLILLNDGKINSSGAKEIIQELIKQDGDPEEIARKKGLIQENNEEELKKTAEKIIKKNPAVVEEYKKGKTSVLQFFIGQMMKETKGSANPEVSKKIFEELLK